MRRAVPAIVLVVMVGACAAPAASTVDPSPPSPPSSAEPSRAASSSATPSEAPSPSATAAPEPIAWTAIEATGPAAREDATWTVDPESRVAYLFGGRDGATVFDDLWAYDLDASAWTAVDVATGPPARFGHEAAWIDRVGLVVVFGQAGPTFYNDVWAFDPAAGTWRELPAGGTAPRERYGSCAAVGPDGRLWISHGFTADGARFADTWAYDANAGAWADETPAGEAPVSRCLHGCWWTDEGGFALYAGQTTGVTAIGDRWELRDDAWASVEPSGPPERNLPAQARLDGATLIVGGQGVDGGYLGDAWLLPDGAAATPITWDGSGPPGRAGAAMIRDGDRLLLFGGRNADGALGDVWALAGVAG